MSLRIRRGTDAQRAGVVFDIGEPVWTTNLEQLWIGDGSTSGGKSIAQGIAGPGLSFNPTTGKLETSNATLTTDDIDEGSTNKYFTNNRASDAAAAMLINGTHTGITYTYHGGTHAIDSIVTLPSSLSANLDLNTYAINGIGNIDIDGYVTLTGTLTTDAIESVPGYDLTLTGSRVVVSSSYFSHTPLLVNGVVSPSSNGSITTAYQDINRISLLSFLPEDIASPGDALGALSIEYQHPTSNQRYWSGMIVQLDPNNILTSTQQNHKLIFGVSGGELGSAPQFFTFDSFGQLAIAQETAQATLDINGIMRLVKQTAEPDVLVEGMIAVADRVTWDPVNKGSGGSYIVYYNGSTWVEQNSGGTGSLFLAGQQTSGSDFNHGYSFSGTEGGHDTGMFSAADGILKLISNTNTVVTVNPNKTITIAELTSAPNSPTVGTIAVADGTSWDPCSVGGLAYPVFFNGSTWIKMFS